MATLKPQVRAIHCDHRADEEQVYAELVRVTAPLDAAWAKLKAAKRIGIKFNQAWRPDRMVYHKGQLLQLVSEKVARATLRLLREETNADLLCTEISVVGLGASSGGGISMPNRSAPRRDAYMVLIRLVRMFRWVPSAPFGFPVVPDV